MEIEFPEIWLDLIEREYKTCYYAIILQAQLINSEKRR